MAEPKAVYTPVEPYTVTINAFNPVTKQTVFDFNVIGETPNYLFGHYAHNPDSIVCHVHKTQVAK